MVMDWSWPIIRRRSCSTCLTIWTSHVALFLTDADDLGLSEGRISLILVIVFGSFESLFRFLLRH